MTTLPPYHDWPDHEAERKLAEGVGTGEIVVIGDGNVPPEDPPEDRVIRTSFLRALILGRIEGHKPHEKGVRVAGAYLRGEPKGAETRGLDLEGCDLPGDLGLLGCRIPDRLYLRNTSLGTLYLTFSYLDDGINASGLSAKGSVFLTGLNAGGELRFVGASLGGVLVGDVAELNAGDNGIALSADRLEASGSVFLRGQAVGERSEFKPFIARGQLRLRGARLGGDLECHGAQLTAGDDGLAISADGMEVAGNVFLTAYGETASPDLHPFEALGNVSLPGAKIAGNIECDGGRFNATKNNSRALTLQGASVTGALFLRKGAKVVGVLDLTSAEVGSITDDPACWPGPGDLALDRCRYGGFGGTGTPLDAQSRIDWLSLQDERRWGAEFWPQPWEECARVLRAMGHEADARAVLIEKEKRQRKARRERLRRAHLYEDAYWYAVWDRVLGATVAYGRKPLLALAWLAGLWLVGALVFGGALARDALKPNLPQIQRAQEWVLCGALQGEAVLTARSADPLAGRRAPEERRIECFHRQPEGQAHPRFDAAVYSLDTLLPVVSLEMQSYWIPDDAAPFGAWARLYLWVHIAAGWFLTLLAVAGLSGLIRTDNTS